MKSLELFGVPMLMLSDYYLTLLGNKYRKRKYGKHFIIETYELNPFFKKDVDHNKLINYKHLFGVTIVTCLLYVASGWQNQDDYKYVLGFCFTLFGMINGRHLNNLLLFNYLIKHQTEISGKVELTHKLVLKISQFQVIVIMLPFLILAMVDPHPLLLGGLSSCVILFFVHMVWIKISNRTRRQTELLQLPR